MKGRPIRKLLLQSFEWFAALALVLGCFVLFLGILSLSFPRGTDLTQLIREREPDGSFSSRLDLDFGLGAEETSESIVATLTRVFRQVKEKRPTSLVWETARLGVRLDERHAVQSFTQSSATIEFDPNNLLRLGENSLVVIRRMERRLDLNRREATLLVLEGELTGRMAEAVDSGFRLRVDTRTSAMRIATTGGRPADFKVQVDPEGASTYAVYDGTAEVVAGGRKIEVLANHAVTVDAEGNAGAATPLPGIPDLAGPAHLAAYTYRSTPSRIRFDWQAVPGADEYTVVVARDDELQDIVVNETVRQTGFVHGNLVAGNYFWRVQARNDGLESAPGELRRLEIRRDDVPPELWVRFPGEGVHGQPVSLEGRTEPGSRVFIDDQEIVAAVSGRFQHELSLEPGINVVVIEAIDPAGNIAYSSGLIAVAY